MSSYAGLSNLPLGSTGNANEKMGPKGLPASAFGKALTPEKLTITERPSYVFLNTTGSFYFITNTTSSIGHTGAGIDGVRNLGITLNSVSQGPVRLDINPVAWSGSAEKGGQTFPQGSVTFVYQGGL